MNRDNEAVRTPEAAVGAEGLDELVDEKVRVAVRVGLPRGDVAEGDLDVHVGVDGQLARDVDRQGLWVRADEPAAMVDDDGDCGELSGAAGDLVVVLLG